MNAAKNSHHRSQRLSPTARKQNLLEGATQFFSEYGLAADTRTLADYLGVSHGLIFRYFPTKEDLLEQIFERISLSARHEEWERILRRTDLPLEDRLVRFYESFLALADEPHWLRIIMFASLGGSDIASRYYDRHFDRLMLIITQSIKGERNDKTDRSYKEAAVSLHATFYYYLLRRHIYRFDVAAHNEGTIRDQVRLILKGALA